MPQTAAERASRLRQVQRETRRIERWLARRSDVQRAGPFGSVDEERRERERIRIAEQRLALLRTEESALAGSPFRRALQTNPLVALLLGTALAGRRAVNERRRSY